MFKVTLTKFDGEKSSIYEGWFTAREVKKQVADWLAEYIAVRIVPAKVSVLELTHDE